MAIRKIFEDKEPRLRKKSRMITDFNERNNILIDDMIETLLDAGGVGLAAPQVGVLRRVVIVQDTNRTELSDREQMIELINPEIIASSGEQNGPEGCLSIPGVYGEVKRPMYVTVKAFDRYGKEFTYDGEGLTARAFCHEIDHLEGKLFTDLATHIYTDEELDAMAQGDEYDEYGEEEEN